MYLFISRFNDDIPSARSRVYLINEYINKKFQVKTTKLIFWDKKFIGLNPINFLYFFYKKIYFLFYLIQHAKKYKLIIFHCYFPNFFEKKILKFYNLPIILDIVDDYYALKKKKLNNLSCAITNNENLMKILKDKNIITYKINDPFLKQKKIKPKKKVKIIGWTGSKTTFTYLKILLPEIFKIMNKNKNLLFYIIGAKQKIFIPKNLKTRIFFYKFNKNYEKLSKIDVGFNYINSDEQSLSKNPYKTFEYFKYGIVQIAVKRGELVSNIKDGHNGYLFEKKEKIASIFEKLISTKNNFQKMSDNCINDFNRICAIEVLGEDFYRIFKKYENKKTNLQ